MKEIINDPIIGACLVFMITYFFKDFFVSFYTAVVTTYTRQFEEGDMLYIQVPESGVWEEIEILNFCLVPFKQKIGVYIMHDDKTTERIEFSNWRNYRKKVKNRK